MCGCVFMTSVSAVNRVIVWLGDMNYRIDLDCQTCLHSIARRDFSYLWKFDQVSPYFTYSLI